MKIRAVVLSAVLLLGASAAFAGQISMEYSFGRPQIREINIGDKIYHRLTMPNAPNGGDIGRPALPARGAQILLPPGARVTGVEVVPGARVFLGRDYLVEPTPCPVPLSLINGSTRLPIPDSAVYASKRPFPETRFKNIGTYGCRGYQILILKLQPVEYIPATGELYYYTDLTIVVNTEETNEPSTLLRGLAEDEREVRSRVDNPEAAGAYSPFAKQPAANYDLLIVTAPLLANAFQPLKDYHDTTGILTEIHTTDDIGSSSPDNVRNYIRERYLNDGIQYVIIGADDDIIPAIDLYVISWEGIIHGDPTFYEYQMPADVYFACLDGPYNYDDDFQWGEPNDGEYGGDVDLIAEVIVGRAAVGTVEEVGRFVDKTIQYLTTEDLYLGNALIAAERLGFGGDAEFGAPYMEEYIDSSSMHGYTTIGVPTDEYNVEEMYDRDWAGTDWPPSEMITRINNGLHFINHLGHSNHDYSLKLYRSTVLSSLTNDLHCFVYTQGCMAGQFDGVDCWAETATIKTDYGAFAAIANARYGYGSSRTTDQTTDSPSQRFDREFWDAVFNPAENKRELGRANQDSKEDNLYRIDEPAMRWCYYQLNLFGDPTVALKKGTCDCGTVWGDVNSTESINPVDVVYMVNHVYLGLDMLVSPPNCPYPCGDVNCDGAVNPVDVVHFVNRVYLDIAPFPCTDLCGSGE